MSVVRILSLTGTEKGSISNHLKKLEASGFVVTRTSKTFGGYRTTVEITQKGLQTCIELLTRLVISSSPYDLVQWRKSLEKLTRANFCRSLFLTAPCGGYDSLPSAQFYLL